MLQSTIALMGMHLKHGSLHSKSGLDLLMATLPAVQQLGVLK